MNISRRNTFKIGIGGLALSLFGMPVVSAYASTELANEAIKKFAGDTKINEGTFTLNTPEIAENGNTVPISIEIESPMSEDDHVKSVAIFADGNPNPEVVTFNFTAVSGVAAAKTRIRLAKTQNIIAVAKMSNGSIEMVKNPVKVTIGGCGG